MPRSLSLYPIVIGATLIVLSVAFHGRQRLFPGAFEEERRLAIEGRRKAQDFNTTVTEDVQGESKPN